MTAAYAATFVSFLTVQRYKLPFVDFKGLLKDGSYRLAVTSGTGHMDDFRVNWVELGYNVMQGTEYFVSL